jgi:hypothetical protein
LVISGRIGMCNTATDVQGVEVLSRR